MFGVSFDETRNAWLNLDFRSWSCGLTCIGSSWGLFEETRRLHPELLAGSSLDEGYHFKIFKAGAFMLLSKDYSSYSTALLKKQRS